MSADNRTIINDCDTNTGWTGDDTATVISSAGSFVEGSAALSTQLSNSDEGMYTTRDTVGAGTFNLDWSDSTLYMLIKDNLTDTFANGGAHFIVGDGTDTVGYFIGGNDAVGMPYANYFASLKLDVSVVVAAPGTVNNDFHEHAGTEANLNHAACTQIGYGSLHLAKAVGSVDNVIMDAFRYVANDSPALIIDGGTSGTAETMADVAADDITNGWGLIANPQGSQYLFFGPTQFGQSASAIDLYLEATNEQWYWMGDNAGGHAMGADHMKFTVQANTGHTTSIKLNGVVVVSTGTRADFDMRDGQLDVLEMDGCTFVGLNVINVPETVVSTSRFITNTIFSNCGIVHGRDIDMSGCSFIDSNVAADEGALYYQDGVDVDGLLDNTKYVMGANAHHAIRFGDEVPASLTLRGCSFEGFGSSDDANDSVFRFDDTSGSITLNLVGCTHDGSGFTVDDAAGVTVTVVIDPVDVEVHVDDNTGADLQNARVLLEAADGLGDFPFEESVTITSSGTTATASHTAHGLENNDYVVIRGADQNEYNGTFQISNVSTNAYDYTMTGDPVDTATGTIIASGAIVYGLTDVNGDISTTRTFSSATDVKGFVRLSTNSPRFKSFPIAGTIDTSLGLSINVRMILDE